MTNPLPKPIFLTKHFPMTREKLTAEVVPRFAALNKAQIDRIRLKQRYSFGIAQQRSVQNRNRYMDIIPFDSSRVHLVTTTVRSKAPTASYINASHIDLKHLGILRKYIASQGPLESTCGDFWLMVLEQRCRVIVCLTRAEEAGMSKCARYWPEAEGQEKEFQTTEGGVRIRVRCTAPVKLNERADCEVRKIRVDRVDLPGQGDGGFEITQLCFFGWPDHAVPERPGHVLELILAMREAEKGYQVEGEVGPSVVHCSAGCGRTGTFCTIDAAWAMLEAKAATWKNEEDDGKDWVYEIVNALREQRVTMVQALPQFMFCYNALWELVGGEARGGSV